MTAAMSSGTVAVPSFELRHRLALALEHAGVSVADMAQELDVHRNTIGRYLNDPKAKPNRATIIAWALRTRVPLDWLEHGGGTTGE